MTDSPFGPPGSILATGQRLINEAVAQIPAGKKHAIVALIDGDRTIYAESIHRVGDVWTFSLGFRKEWEKKPTMRFLVQAAW